MTDIILENDRVLLRPLTMDDYALLLPFSLNEPETWQFAPKSAAGAENLKTYFLDAITQKEAGIALPFIVFDKASKQYAGSTRFYNISEPNRSAEIGYTWYGKAFRGSGLNRQCKFLLLQYAFESRDRLRIAFRADATNSRSIAAMKSIGAKEEGVLRQDTVMPDGRFRDTVVLSILQQEWYQSVKNALQHKMSKG